MQYDFNLVSATALVPAFARGEYTDIPFASEVLAFLRAKHLALSDALWSEKAAYEFAPFFEARFKAVNRILEEYGATQVLELAAGLSPRSMDFAQRGIAFVETDLPESSASKREMVTAVLGSVPPNLTLCAASVLDRSQMLECCAGFGGRPLAVTTEGLLRYLTFEEKTRLSAIVHELLSRFGGIWVTTDIHLRHFARRRAPINREKETERLGRNLNPNYFDDLEHARSFFESCRFEVESRDLLEGIRERVTSLPNAPDELVAELTERQTFILRVKH